MYHDLLRDASFWAFLFGVDKDLADRARQQGCPCGGRLHCANYPRKPRGGGDDLPQEYGCRLSFCCDREGCRKRVTPPSVRFLGRKIYLGAVVILVAAMRQGPSPRRVRELSRLFGADRHTIARWRVFWSEHFPQTPFWKAARGRVVPAEDLVHGLSQAIQKRGLPRALLTDNGAAMIADEVTEGLLRLGIVHEKTLPYSPYQNGKQECFWASLEGRLMEMLGDVRNLSLEFLNEATQRLLFEPDSAAMPADAGLCVDKGSPDQQLPPLLKRLLAEYAATGLPPAYLPKNPPAHTGETP